MIDRFWSLFGNPGVLRGTLTIARVSACVVIALLAGCKPAKQIKPDPEMPPKMIWAWERPEDLRFLDPKEFGVAFLAQTLFLEKDRVDRVARRQPLEVNDGTYMIAVTRIETVKETSRRPAYSDEQIAQTVDRIKRTLELPNVKGIQIDFDSAVSEREFYRRLILETRRVLSEPPAKSTPHGDAPAGTPLAGGQSGNSPKWPATHAAGSDKTLTMTSLASWCTGDAWFNDFPVDEAVPMVFVMGADTEKIRNYLRNGNDWQEPLCKGSYGISVDEQPVEGLKPGRRIWYFKNSSWTKADLERL